MKIEILVFFIWGHCVNAQTSTSSVPTTITRKIKLGLNYVTTSGYDDEMVFPTYGFDAKPFIDAEFVKQRIKGIAFSSRIKVLHLKNDINLEAELSYGLFPNTIILPLDTSLSKIQGAFEFRENYLQLISIGGVCTKDFAIRKLQFVLVFGLRYSTSNVPKVDRTGTVLGPTGEIVTWNLKGGGYLPRPVLTPTWGIDCQLLKFKSSSIWFNIRWSYSNLYPSYNLRFAKPNAPTQIVSLGKDFSTGQMGLIFSSF